MSPATTALALTAGRLPSKRIEALAQLMEAGAFPGDPVASARGAACVALTHLAGACTEHLPRLTLADWLPGGRQVVALDPIGFYPRRREALARLVSVPDTAVVVVERYLTLRQQRGGPSAPLLSRADGSSLKAATPLRKAHRKACVALGLDPETTLGCARGLYCQAIADLNREDGLYEYMCGIGRSVGSRRGGFSFTAPPPDEVMAAALATALPLAAPWRRLASDRGLSWTWASKVGLQSIAKRGIQVPH